MTKPVAGQPIVQVPQLRRDSNGLVKSPLRGRKVCSERLELVIPPTPAIAPMDTSRASTSPPHPLSPRKIISQLTSNGALSPRETGASSPRALPGATPTIFAQLSPKNNSSIESKEALTTNVKCDFIQDPKKIYEVLKEYLCELDKSSPIPATYVLQHRANLMLVDLISKGKVKVNDTSTFDDHAKSLLFRNWQAAFCENCHWLQEPFERLQLLKEKLDSTNFKKEEKWPSKFCELLIGLMKPSCTLRQFLSLLKNSPQSMRKLITQAIGGERIVKFIEGCVQLDGINEEYLGLLARLSETVLEIHNLQGIMNPCEDIVRLYIPDGIQIISLEINGSPFIFKSLDQPVIENQKSFFFQLISKIAPSLEHHRRLEEASLLATKKPSIFTPLLSQATFLSLNPCHFQLQELFNGFRVKREVCHGNPAASIRFAIHTPSTIVQTTSYTILTTDAQEDWGGEETPEAQLFLRWTIDLTTKKGKVELLDLISFPNASEEAKSKILDIINWKGWLHLNGQKGADQKTIFTITTLNLSAWLAKKNKRIPLNQDKKTLASTHTTHRQRLCERIFQELALYERGSTKIFQIGNSPSLYLFDKLIKQSFPLLFGRGYEIDKVTLKGCKIKPNLISRLVTYHLQHRNQCVATLEICCNLHKKPHLELNGEIVGLQFEASVPYRVRLQILSDLSKNLHTLNDSQS